VSLGAVSRWSRMAAGGHWLHTQPSTAMRTPLVSSVPLDMLGGR
jgi:hypothetical protein